MARRTVTSCRNSRGSTDPTNAVTAADDRWMDDGQRHQKGKAQTQVDAAPSWNRNQLDESHRARPENELPDHGHVKHRGWPRRAECHPRASGTMTMSSKTRSRRSEFLLLTSAILSRPSLSGKQVGDGSRYTSIDVPRLRGLSPCWVTPDSPPCPPPGGGGGIGRRTQHEAREARRDRPELSARHRLGGWRTLEGIAPSNSRLRVPNSHFRPEVLAYAGASLAVLDAGLGPEQSA